jgi:hypothetical protein
MALPHHFPYKMVYAPLRGHRHRQQLHSHAEVLPGSGMPERMVARTAEQLLDRMKTKP